MHDVPFKWIDVLSLWLETKRMTLKKEMQQDIENKGLYKANVDALDEVTFIRSILRKLDRETFAMWTTYVTEKLK